MRKRGFLTIDVILMALWETLVKFSPHIQLRNPVIFVAYLGAIITSVITYTKWSSFNFQISLWLWFTIIFANFSSAIAESRGKAHAASIKKSQKDAYATKWVDGKEEVVPAESLQKGERVVCKTGDIIPADGDVVKGIATVDESAITGESAPVIREAGGDRSAVTAGTKVVSDWIIVEVTSEKGRTFLDRMVGLIEGAQRQKTPNEIALNIVLSSLTILFLLTVVSLYPLANYSGLAAKQDLSEVLTIPVLIALLVCLIPTTISSLLSAIGIAGMDRLIQRNVIAKSGRSIEAAGNIDLLILDKTGTITLGNRMATEFFPIDCDPKYFAEMAQLASIGDETPEGRSIVVLAKNKYNLRGKNFNTEEAKIVPFSAETRMSGIDLPGKIIRKGAQDAIKKHIEKLGGTFPEKSEQNIEMISQKGASPLVLAENNRVLGVIMLKDIVKGGIKERFADIRKGGIRTLMITGDNFLTAGAIAAEAGVDDYVAEATPEIKLNRVREEHKQGHIIAVTGDGTNDAPALAQADVGVAMNTGTQVSRDAGNMVDLDSNPTKLIEIIEIGKQLLMTRGSLTTFSIANDVAKYFAIIPAIFGGLYAEGGERGPLSQLNVMDLNSPQSAILSAVIFNAIIIIALIPIALKGVAYRPQPAVVVLRKNILIYGLGGIIAPFIGIKLIDMIITNIGLL